MNVTWLTPVSLTPSLFLKFFRAELCLWWSMLDDVTIIGIRCAVVSPVEWLRSWNIAILRELHSSMLLLPFRLTVKHGTSVSGPISFKYSRASWSCSLKKTNLSFNWLYLWFVIYFCESSWDTLASSSLLLPMILSLINSFCFFSDIPFHADGSGLVVSMINWSSSSGRVIHKQYKILAVYIHSDRIRPYPFLCKPITCSKDISCDKHGSHHRKIL